MIDGWVIHRFHRFPQIGLGGRRTEDRGMGERIDSFKELRVYKEAWALNLEVLLLAIICVNLCESVDNPSRSPAFA